MSIRFEIPKAAIVSIGDMLDNCAKIQPGQEVLLLAHIDGLHGSDNMVDEQAISWIQSSVKLRGANASILWIGRTGYASRLAIPAGRISRDERVRRTDQPLL